MRWTDEEPRWPNAAFSRFVEAGAHRWHVQSTANPGRPTTLLLHGLGASTHSWRDVLPALATDRRVIAVDLPGHGFTRPLARVGMSGGADGIAAMSAEILRLLDALKAAPSMVMGHSAGAAVAARLWFDAPRRPDRLVLVNPALTPFPGPASVAFPAMAKLLAANPFSGPTFARFAAALRGSVSMSAATGSRIDADGAALYQRLMEDPGHVSGALDMMARWDLTALHRALPAITAPTLLLLGERDRVTPWRAGRMAGEKIPNAQVETYALGHLLHEERPALTAERIRAFEADQTQSSPAAR